jgi:hypothetical protein
MKPATKSDNAVTVARLERGLALLAYLIELEGPVYAPLFEKLEPKTP